MYRHVNIDQLRRNVNNNWLRGNVGNGNHNNYNWVQQSTHNGGLKKKFKIHTCPEWMELNVVRNTWTKLIPMVQQVYIILEKRIQLKENKLQRIDREDVA